jgi:hypothetical protein
MNYTDNFYGKGLPSGFMTVGSPFFDLGNYFHFIIGHVMDNDKGANYECLWNKMEQKLICFKDNFDDLLFTDLSLETVGPNNEWISFIQPIDLLENLDKIKENTQFDYPKELISQIQNLHEQDNPVMVVFTLK